ncbi:hypothetical protein [Absidia glauca]|uniref:Uncharacterized protein n=1 Tax=Absidia glauca TaxID=4829 RepID=A0A168PPH1_ABSGL|nr:hypothetical protein [Absidia glauca]
MRLYAVKNYANVFIQHPGTSPAQASILAAKSTYQGRSPESMQRRRADAIRGWAEEFVVDGGISRSRQGKHVKSVSILGGEDMKVQCLEWLKGMKPMARDIYLLKKLIDKKLASGTCLDTLQNENENENDGDSKQTGVSVNTIRNYLVKWGFSFRKNIKGIFFDGHERPDVVTYREAWATRMMNKSRSMTMYEGEDMEIEILPSLRPGYKMHVMVTHDESVFYANDGKNKGWFLPGEVHLRSKGPGRSIMVSEFQCPCHGTMRHNGMVSKKLFERGSGRESYWTHHDVVKQLQEEVIPIFKALHPNCMGIFLFDQSSNHKAYADDALVASRMNLNPHVHPKNKPKFRKTDFYVKKPTGKRRRDGTLKHEMHFIGVKATLQQRGLWHDEDTSAGRTGMKWRLFCGNNNTINNEGNVQC